MALAGLDQVSGGIAICEVVLAGERVGAGAVGEIVEAAAADVGDIDAEADLVLAAAVRDEVGAIEVRFSATRISLCAACSKQA